MSLSQLRSNHFLKLAGLSLVAVIAVLTLIRCSPNEPAVAATTPAVTDSAKDAETTAAAIAAAKATADGEKVAEGGKKHKHGKRSIASVNNIYVVQIGAFKVKENAEKLEKKLKDAGYPVRLVSMNHSKNGELHLVRFEPSNNRTEAEQAVETLKSKESITAELLTLPAGT